MLEEDEHVAQKREALRGWNKPPPQMKKNNRQEAQPPQRDFLSPPAYACVIVLLAIYFLVQLGFINSLLLIGILGPQTLKTRFWPMRKKSDLK